MSAGTSWAVDIGYKVNHVWDYLMINKKAGHLKKHEMAGLFESGRSWIERTDGQQGERLSVLFGGRIFWI